MREILFRGKQVDNGEWVEGFYCGENCKTPWSPATKETNIIQQGTLYWYEIIPETVGQYTGLTDKNGEKIFEGDIVNYNGSIHEVVFENRCYNARFGIMVEENETWSFDMSVPPYFMEVIGNIHDNPELLEGRR